MTRIEHAQSHIEAIKNEERIAKANNDPHDSPKLSRPLSLAPYRLTELAILLVHFDFSGEMAAQVDPTLGIDGGEGVTAEKLDGTLTLLSPQSRVLRQLNGTCPTGDGFRYPRDIESLRNGR